jgi:hypothetical protein
MKELERLAIKYLLIGLGIGLLRYLIMYSQIYTVEFFTSIEPKIIFKITTQTIAYSTNIIVGAFIFFDSIKYTKNKLIISLTGFLMPVIGVCFLIIEKYLIFKISDNE